jgi:predicted O-methyltransferase YrrM
MLRDLDVPMPPHYERILQRSTDMQFPMNSDVLTGALLRALARMKPGGMFLELGTGCGLGTCWLLDGMNADSTLVSVDNSPAVQAIARDELGADARLTFVFEDGGEFLESCENGFDLIYADAWPGKYSHLDRALALLNRGGIYVIDDMLPQPNWSADHPPKVAALLQTLDALDGFEIAKLSWSTGIVLAVKC